MKTIIKTMFGLASMGFALGCAIWLMSFLDKKDQQRRNVMPAFSFSNNRFFLDSAQTWRYLLEQDARRRSMKLRPVNDSMWVKCYESVRCSMVFDSTADTLLIAGSRYEFRAKKAK